MDLQLEPDQLELQEIARGVLDRHAPLSLAREYEEGKADAPAELWRNVAELDWMSLATGEDDGFGLVGALVVAREVGFHVAPVPFVDHVVAGRILASAPAGPAQEKWGAKLAAGDPTAALAVIEDGADWSLVNLGATATPDGDGWKLSGVKRDVAHGANVGAIAVLADTGDGLGLFFVDPGAAGVTVAPLHGFDHSRALARVTLNGVAVAAEDAVTGADEAIAAALRAGALLSAAEGIGAADGALVMAIAYANERQQFRTPIGAFQALAHVIADLHVARETAWSSILYAGAATDDGIEGAVEATAIAKAHAARSAREVAEGALQVFGGIAFSTEADVHLLHARALECEQRFGDSRDHERVLTGMLRARTAEKGA